MFKAIIIACVLNSPDACMEISDTYGPYSSQGRCFTRLEEMEYELAKLWDKYNMKLEFKQSSCIAVEGEST